MEERKGPMDPTRKLLKVFGVKVTDYEERTAELLQQYDATTVVPPGLAAEIDRYGNVYGRSRSAAKTVLIGSHTDSVPKGGWLDGALGTAEFYAGDALSIADITVTTCLMQIELVADIALDPWPALAAHQKRMRARDSIAAPYARAERFLRKALPERVSLAQS